MQRLNDSLDLRESSLRLFFRNDDAGWQQDRLDRLLGLFADFGLPVDLAVIPAALTEQGASDLNRWCERHRGIGLHQHGYAHLNHESDGVRKCEFGNARPIERQCADIAMGREKLRALLERCDPIFTPPWNRCLPETVGELPRLGFAAFSDAGKLVPSGQYPRHLPVALDWERERHRGSLGPALAQIMAQPGHLAGIMLHHATMDAEALIELRQFLDTIHRHPGIEFVSMQSQLEPTTCAN